jgi:hypothetical protein
MLMLALSVMAQTGLSVLAVVLFSAAIYKIATRPNGSAG